MINLTRKLIAIHSHMVSQGLERQSSCSYGGSQDTLHLGRTIVHMSFTRFYCHLVWRGQNENCLKRGTDNRTKGKESKKQEETEIISGPECTAHTRDNALFPQTTSLMLHLHSVTIRS
jgi:hypothetical protein